MIITFVFQLTFRSVVFRITKGWWSFKSKLTKISVRKKWRKERARENSNFSFVVFLRIKFPFHSSTKNTRSQSSSKFKLHLSLCQVQTIRKPSSLQDNKKIMALFVSVWNNNEIYFDVTRNELTGMVFKIE